VVHALDVTPGTRVAVPEPRSPGVGPPLENPGLQPEPAQAVQHVETRETGAHHGHVDVHRAAGTRPQRNHGLPGVAAAMDHWSTTQTLERTLPRPLARRQQGLPR